jgi:hypothetical protein
MNISASLGLVQRAPAYTGSRNGATDFSANLFSFSVTLDSCQQSGVQAFCSIFSTVVIFVVNRDIFFLLHEKQLAAS